MSKIIRKYLTQDFNSEDKFSYLNYIKGDKTSDSWMVKSLLRREPLLLLELKCGSETSTGSICNNWININEFGVCKCLSSHCCNDLVIKTIQTLI